MMTTQTTTTTEMRTTKTATLQLYSILSPFEVHPTTVTPYPILCLKTNQHQNELLNNFLKLYLCPARHLQSHNHPFVSESNEQTTTRRSRNFSYFSILSSSFIHIIISFLFLFRWDWVWEDCVFFCSRLMKKYNWNKRFMQRPWKIIE